MKTSSKSILRFTFFLAILLMLGLVARAADELNLDFKLVNKTGYDLKEVYISPTATDDWGDNIIKATLKDGETLALVASPKASAKKWDIKCVYTDGEEAEWHGYKLEEISTITLFWSKEKGSTAKAE